jgi:hypothetical protein
MLLDVCFLHFKIGAFVYPHVILGLKRNLVISHWKFLGKSLSVANNFISFGMIRSMSFLCVSLQSEMFGTDLLSILLSCSGFVVYNWGLSSNVYHR